MKAPPKPAPFTDEEIRVALRMRAEEPRRRWDDVAAALGRPTYKGVESRLARLREFHGVRTAEDYDRHLAAGRPERLNAAAVARPVRRPPPPQPTPRSAPAAAKTPSSGVFRSFIGPWHHDAEERKAEQRRAEAVQRMIAGARRFEEKHGRPQTEEELRAAIERHLETKGVTKLPTMGQHDFDKPWDRFG